MEPAPTPHCLVEREGPVAIVTLNRPERKNALSLEMLVRMAEAWAAIDADPEIRVAILTGAGGDFCSGADLKMMHGNYEDDPWQRRFMDDPDLQWKALLRHYDLKKPLLAAVEGTAVGGGTEILQATDIRIAGEGAVFGLTEVKWGLFPLGGSTARLARQIPYTVAMEMLLTGRTLTAAEAREVGLVGRVVPRGEALAKAREIAEVVAANAPLAVRAVKQSVKEGLLLDEKAALARELELGLPVVFGSEDAKEGARAFREKRRPVYRGA